MFEFTPLAVDSQESERVSRAIGRGPRLDLLMLDLRSNCGPNTEATRSNA